VLKKRVFPLALLVLVLIAMSVLLGSVPPSPVYYLKVTRESIQTFFIFGSEDKAGWFLTRADKRITEAEKLKTKHLDFFASQQIRTAMDYQSHAQIMLEDLKNKTSITYLTDKYTQNSDRLKTLSQ
jgi:hypothetical protein